MESEGKYCVRINIYGTEITDMMRGPTYMRRYIDSYFVQIVHGLPKVPKETPGDYFNKDSMRWDVLRMRQ